VKIQQGINDNIINHNLSLEKKKNVLKKPHCGGQVQSNLFVKSQCCITEVNFNGVAHEVT
jgi:hypothetical protein